MSELRAPYGVPRRRCPVDEGFYASAVNIALTWTIGTMCWPCYVARGWFSWLRVYTRPHGAWPLVPLPGVVGPKRREAARRLWAREYGPLLQLFGFGEDDNDSERRLD